ncbi:protein of unknown function [Hyphomicrobium sp. 1Nfss2.1]
MVAGVWTKGDLSQVPLASAKQRWRQARRVLASAVEDDKHGGRHDDGAHENDQAAADELGHEIPPRGLRDC